MSNPPPIVGEGALPFSNDGKGGNFLCRKTYEEWVKKQFNPILFSALPIGARFYSTGTDSFYIKTGPDFAVGAPGGGDEKATMAGYNADYVVWLEK